MARLGRYFLPDQPLHVIQRGNNREGVFFCDDDYERYRDWLAQAAARHGCVIYAYVLMTNHVHLLATPQSAASLPRMMQAGSVDMIDAKSCTYVRRLIGFSRALIFAAAIGSNVWANEDVSRSKSPPLADASADTGSVAHPEIATIVQRLALPRGATAVAWSPDKKSLATVGGLKQQIMLWDARSGKLLWERSGNFGGEQTLAFSNDGKLLLVSGAGNEAADGDATLTLWDAATGTIAGYIAGPFPGEGAMGNSARAIALDREHELMAVVAFQDPGRPVAIYDMRNWKLKGTVTVEEDTPQTLAFGRDGTLAVGTVGGRIALFDARTQRLKRTIVIYEFVESLAFSPDGKYVAAGFADVADPIRIWSTTDGALVRSYVAGRLADIRGLAWSPDGRYLATTGFDNVVRLWPAASDRPPGILVSFKMGARSVAFSPDGAFLAAAGNEGAIIVQIR